MQGDGKDFHGRQERREEGISQAACHVAPVAEEIPSGGGEGKEEEGGGGGKGEGWRILEDTLAPPTPLPGQS